MPCLDTIQTLAGKQIPGQGGEVAAETRGPDIFVPVDVDEANKACKQAARTRLLWGGMAGAAAAVLTFGTGRLSLAKPEDQP